MKIHDCLKAPFLALGVILLIIIILTLVGIVINWQFLLCEWIIAAAFGLVVNYIITK
jgi:hypothetical protein